MKQQKDFRIWESRAIYIHIIKMKYKLIVIRGGGGASYQQVLYQEILTHDNNQANR